MKQTNLNVYVARMVHYVKLLIKTDSKINQSIEVEESNDRNKPSLLELIVTDVDVMCSLAD